MPVSRQMIAVLAVVLAGLGPGVSGACAQEAAQPRHVQIPTGAVTLEGIPTARIDSTEQGAARRVLGDAEASRENKLLQLNSSGPYTYFSSEPGKYVRCTRINDRISYVEHVDSALRSVTWRGELRIAGGKR
jgi:hypothetical protein